jgi:hypothetical protein
MTNRRYKRRQRRNKSERKLAFERCEVRLLLDASTVLHDALSAFHGPDLQGKDGPMSSIGLDLSKLYYEFAEHREAGSPGEFAPTNNLMHVTDNSVVIDVVAQSDPTEVTSLLKSLGMSVTATWGSYISGRFPIDQLVHLGDFSGIASTGAAMAIRNAGSTTTQGDIAQRSNQARANFGVDGSGITVGTLSDSYNALGGAAADVTSGDLPAGVVVLADLAGGSLIDEGRGMMQLIHDVAPGAAQQFHTAFAGIADFAQGIVDLANAGSDIINDDVIYFSEPMFQDGPIAQAIDQVVAGGASYFSSAGNSARQSYESPFRNSGIGGFGGTLHDFDPGAGIDTFQQVTINPGREMLASFQWDEPFSGSLGPGSTSDIDIYLLDGPSTAANVLASSTANNLGSSPLEIFSWENTGGAAQTAYIAIANFAGPDPGLMKYVDFGDAIIQEFDTQSPTSYGHSNAAGASAVGAAFYFSTPDFGTAPPQLEGFSSAGGIPILFDTQGNRLPAGQVRNTPDIVAPDGGNTTFFGGDIGNVEGTDPDNFPNFFGTSAAAPHAAGVVALLLEHAGGPASLTPAQIYSILESTAIDMDDPGTAGFDVGYDFGSGFGLIDANAALVSTATSTIRGTVWEDLDSDAVQDANENGLSNWTVFLDADGDGQLDGNETVAVSDQNGDYEFTGLAAGTYTVDQVVQATFEQTFPVNGAAHSVNLESNATVNDIDFGNVPLPDVFVIDDGDLGFSDGNFTEFQGEGFLGDVHFSAADSGNTASWTFTGLTPGVYRVSTTWFPHVNRATNAPFAINGGAPILVNQELPPAPDVVAGGTAFQDLNANYLESGSILTVTLTDIGANENVIADAVQIERTGDLPTDPEIVVLSGGANVADETGLVNLGSTDIGAPIVSTLTVQNTGSAALALSGPISVPSGFSIASGFGSTSLTPGASTTFQVRLDAASVGAFSGELSFGNNDADENSFNFTIQGTVTAAVTSQIIDDGDAGYAAGGFTFFSGQGFQNDVRFSAAGGGNSSSWNFIGLTDGLYRVSVTWTPHPNRATNAPFSIDGGASIVVNQELPPTAHVIESGFSFQDLDSSYAVTGSTLSVSLTDVGANEFVIADAVRIERTGDLPSGPEISVLDGATEIADGLGVVNFGSAVVGSPSTRTLIVENTGTTNLTLSEPISLPAGFSIASSFASTTVTAGVSTTFQVRLDAATAGSYSGLLSFGNNDADENPYNFTIQGTVTAATASQVIDDGDPGFSNGGFTFFSGQGFQNDVRFSAANSGNTATWTFTGLTPGVYRVSATWSPHPNRATNAPYSFGGSTVLINQELAPAPNVVVSGFSFQDLASAQPVSGNSLVVSLSDSGANQFVIADAVRIERTGDLPSPGSEQIIDDGDSGFNTPGNWVGPFLGQGFQNDVYFSAANSGGAATWNFTGLTPGVYRVSATWSEHPNRATNAPFSINGSAPILVNQENAPVADVVVGGVNFQDLSVSHQITGTALTVSLTNVGANEFVIADAVRIEQLSPLRLSGRPVNDQEMPIDGAAIQGSIETAILHWSKVDRTAPAALANVQVRVADLSSDLLGLASLDSHTIWLDDNAAGYGWHVDQTALWPRPFAQHENVHGSIDLLSAVSHELGHLLGLEDIDSHADYGNVMNGVLSPDSSRFVTREFPTLNADAIALHVENFFAQRGNEAQLPRMENRTFHSWSTHHDDFLHESSFAIFAPTLRFSEPHVEVQLADEFADECQLYDAVFSELTDDRDISDFWLD